MDVILTTSEAAGVGKDGCVHAWDSRSGAFLKGYKGGSCTPAGLCCTRDLVVASQVDRPCLHFWHPHNESLQLKVPLPERVASVACTPDSAFAFAASLAGKLYVWEVGSGRLVTTITAAHFRRIGAMAVNADGTFLVTGGDDAVVKLWRISSLVSGLPAAECVVRTWAQHSLPVTAVSCGTGHGLFGRVFSASRDRTCKVFEMASGALLCSVAFPSDVTALAIDPAERFMYAGGSQGLIYKLDLHDPAHHATTAHGGAQAGLSDTSRAAFAAHTEAVVALAVSSDGALVVSASADGTARVWDVNTCQAVRSYTQHRGPLTNVLMVPSSWLSAPGRLLAPVSLFARRPPHQPTASEGVETARDGPVVRTELDAMDEPWHGPGSRGWRTPGAEMWTAWQDDRPPYPEGPRPHPAAGDGAETVTQADLQAAQAATAAAADWGQQWKACAMELYDQSAKEAMGAAMPARQPPGALPPAAPE